ncbi:ABC transporter permease subunit [Amorphoplanes nipponensis]|uniref:ABC transporter permease n=1 Tax=Actinoplanes nipponensis TaxID=135950 RepID=A0A919JQI7_9ACTN|nr:ABC transporter permease [Actinoplanes nipponensis]GIE53490.1 ABC transporter permease [Actinoplanes nipponensis]
MSGSPAAFVLRRTGRGLLTLAAVSVVTFLMFFAVPRDPAAAMCPKNCDAARLEQIRAQWGLSDPVAVQYAHYVRGVVAGRDLGRAQGGYCPAPCLGYSYVNGEPVIDALARALPVTMSIVLPAAVLWLALGIGLGVAAAARHGSPVDRMIGGFSLAGLALPLYLLGSMFLLLFVYQLGVLPYPHYTALTESPLAWASGLVLPWCTLALLFSAGYIRLTRAQVREAMSADFVRTALAKGLAHRRVVRRHALRPALVPLVTAAGLDVGAALGGTVITEVTFGLYGLGQVTLDAVREDDLPMLMGAVLVAALVVVAANIVVDGLYARIDPRVRAR